MKKTSVLGILSMVALATLGMVFGLSNSASANPSYEFSWTTTGNNMVGSGFLYAETVPVGFPCTPGFGSICPPGYPFVYNYFRITNNAATKFNQPQGITGIMNGLPIAKLYPPSTLKASDTGLYNDNLLYEVPIDPFNSNIFLTQHGVGFSTSCSVNMPPFGNVNICGPVCPPEVCPPNGIFPPDGYDYILRSKQVAPLSLELLASGAQAGSIITVSLVELLRAQVGGSGSDSVLKLVGEGELRLELVATATPEPSTLTLLGLGIAALAGITWRRHRRKPA